MRNSSDTDTSYERPRPVYRGQHPLKVSDIQHVIDISPQAMADYENPQHGWPRPNHDVEDDGDLSDSGCSYHSRRHFIDKEILDQFPTPPPSTPISYVVARPAKPTRPLQRPPTMNMDDFTNDLLPEFSPTLKAKMDATLRYREQELLREAQALERRQKSMRHNATVNAALGRSTSSASAYTRAPSAHTSSKASLDRKNGIRSPSSVSLASNSMSTPANTGLYRNPVSSLSTQSLAPNARLRGQQPPTKPPISHPQPLTQGRHRNTSTSSSASTLSSRRPVVPSPLAQQYSSNYTQHQGPQNTDLYHPSVMRVLRGPHGATLQCPKPVRPGRVDVAALEVNDAEEGQQWGIAHGRGAGAKYHPGHNVKPMAATIAGYGKSGMRR